jgi:hypothetical protein
MNIASQYGKRVDTVLMSVIIPRSGFWRLLQRRLDCHRGEHGATDAKKRRFLYRVRFEEVGDPGQSVVLGHAEPFEDTLERHDEDLGFTGCHGYVWVERGGAVHHRPDLEDPVPVDPPLRRPIGRELLLEVVVKAKAASRDPALDAARKTRMRPITRLDDLVDKIAFVTEASVDGEAIQPAIHLSVRDRVKCYRSFYCVLIADPDEELLVDLGTPDSVGIVEIHPARQIFVHTPELLINGRRHRFLPVRRGGRADQ